MKSNRELILECFKSGEQGQSFSTKEIAQMLGLRRSNVSTILNEFVDDQVLVKGSGRPVLYQLRTASPQMKVDPFKKIIGQDNSLRNAITLAKTTVIYPDPTINMFLIGEEGVGKSRFAQTIYEYALQSEKIKADAPYNKINCQYFEDSKTSIFDVLFGKKGDSERSLFDKSVGGVLFIDEVDYLPPNALRKMMHFLNEGEYYDAKKDCYKEGDLILICASSKHSNNPIVESFLRNIPAVINIPSYNERPFKERMELIKYFYRVEATRINSVIKVSSETIHSLLLYNPRANTKQLKNDIKMGCARSFARQINGDRSRVVIELSDMPHDVQKAVWKYAKYKHEIEHIAPKNSIYTFSRLSLNVSEDDHENEDSYNIYHIMDQRAHYLSEKGIGDHKISEIISSETEDIFNNYELNLHTQKLNKEELSKIVDEKIINVAEDFLDLAGEEFNITYPTSVYYGFAMHLSMVKERQSQDDFMTSKEMNNIMNISGREYTFTLKNIAMIEKVLEYQFPMQEIIYTTVFLSQPTTQRIRDQHPSILIVMHGESTASSIADAVNDLVKLDNAYGFDINLDVSTDLAYAMLKDEIKRIDHGQGLIVIYDMGSIKTMCDMIATQTGVELRLVQIPITLLALEFSRQASYQDNLDVLYHTVINEEMDALKRYVEVENTRKKNAILVLCNTGEGAAQEIKRYLEDNINLDEFAIIPLSHIDRARLKESIKNIKRTYNINSIVAATNPMLGYNFISFVDIFDNHENLERLFNYEPLPTKDISLQEVNIHIAQYFEGISLVEDGAQIERVVDLIFKEFAMEEQDKFPLYLHLVSNIDRIKTDKPLIINPDREEIIENYGNIFKKVLKLLSPLEHYFDIIFTDDDVSVIVEVIAKH